jgi:hypothetical protein
MPRLAGGADHELAVTAELAPSQQCLWRSGRLTDRDFRIIETLEDLK